MISRLIINQEKEKKMYAKKCKVNIEKGLHARLSAQIAEEAIKYSDHEKVFIRKVNGNQDSAQAGSVMDLLVLSASNKTKLEVFSEDDSAAATVDKIADFIDCLR
jgi:PTS HPr component phosphorylation site.